MALTVASDMADFWASYIQNIVETNGTARWYASISRFGTCAIHGPEQLQKKLVQL